MNEDEIENDTDNEPVRDLFTACMVCEGVYEATEERQLSAWQYLVNSGDAWRLQGWYGRTASQMIEDGLILPAGASQAGVVA